MNPKKHLNWQNLIFFTLTPIVAIVGSLCAKMNGGLPWQTWLLTGILVYASGLGITSGYHRLFAHKTYRAAWPVRIFYLLFGGMTFQGSARWWAAEHRTHHKYVDTARDPYGINKGFWYAHIGWLFTRSNTDENYEHVKDLDQDLLVVWQQRLYLPIAILTSFFFPMAIASLWGDPWGGFFLAGFGRMVFVHHATFCINSFCHYLGRQNYSDKNSARDSWITALMTFGEGYHNFHHEFQYDYRNGVRAYHWDPGKWLIRFFAGLGLAYDLRRADKKRILAAKLEMQQKQVAQRLAMVPDSYRTRALELLNSAREQLQQAHARFVELKQEYQRLKSEKIHSMSEQLEQLRREIRAAKREFRLAMAEWRSLCRGQWVAAT